MISYGVDEHCWVSQPGDIYRPGRLRTHAVCITCPVWPLDLTVCKSSLADAGNG